MVQKMVRKYTEFLFEVTQRCFYDFIDYIFVVVFHCFPMLEEEKKGNTEVRDFVKKK